MWDDGAADAAAQDADAARQAKATPWWNYRRRQPTYGGMLAVNAKPRREHTTPTRPVLSLPVARREQLQTGGCSITDR